MWPKRLGKEVEAGSGFLERITLVTSSPRSGEIREGGHPGDMSELSSGNKGGEVCCWQKAQLVQRPGSRARAAVQEAGDSMVRPEWSLSWGGGRKEEGG